MALKKLFEDGVVKREDLFITSKIWSGLICHIQFEATCEIYMLTSPYKYSEFCRFSDHAPEDVPEAIAAILPPVRSSS